MRERWIRFLSPVLGGAPIEVLNLDGTDELNRLFEFDVQLVGPTSAFSSDLNKLLDSPASLVFESDGKPMGRIHGIVSSLSHHVEPGTSRALVQLHLVPRAWLMTQQRGNQIYLGRTYPEILADKLTAIGLEEGVDFIIAFDDVYGIREYVTQYEETDYAFFCRLCEHLGIATFFDHREGRDILMLADDASHFQPLRSRQIFVRSKRDHPAAYDVKTSLSRRPQTVRVHDYNYRMPRLPLNDNAVLESPMTRGQWTEYGAHTKTPFETTSIARVRAEELAARQTVVRGHATDLSMRAGGVVTLVDGEGGERTLLLSKVHFSAYPSEENGATEKHWDNTFEAIPIDVTYRPERVTPRPRVTGLVNAIVDGAINGPYAELDDSGRYHLRMFFDRSGRADMTATHPVRMMQPHSGANYGMHFPLRPGTEVLVGFVDGDPDRPVIVGTAPNPETASPVFDANQTQNVLRTGSNNEMVIEDEIGQERIRIHTPNENTTIQLGAEQEPEVGALTTTEAHISQVSRQSNNQVTDRRTVIADNTTSVVGNTAVLLAGVDGISAASERGIERPESFAVEELRGSLERLSVSPGDLAELLDDPGASDQNEPAGGVHASGLWSALASAIATMTEEAAFRAVQQMAAAADESLDSALGRSQGQALGTLLTPAFIAGAKKTAALVSRDATLVYGDRVATLGSHDSASVVGDKMAQLKSPGTVEVAAGESMQLSTPGVFDVAAGKLQFVGGYYPDSEPPPLEDGTSVGVMSRHDLHVISVEDCILICAKKNLIGSAHDGDVRITAGGTVAIKGASITGSAGSISLRSGGDITIEAGGTVTIDAPDIVLKATTVTVEASLLYVDAPNSLFSGEVQVSGTVTAADFKCG